MKKLLLLTKTLLAVALLCVGQNAWGDGNKRVIEAQNYESALSTDWSAPGNGESKLIENDATYGKYSQSNYKSGAGNNRSCYKSVVTTNQGAGKTTSALTTAGYNVEFDINLTPGSNVDRTQNQFIAYTANSITANTTYGGTDYIFSLSTTRNNTTWYVNDLTNTSNSVTLTSNHWYHVKLVVTASSVSYTITDNSTSGTITNGTGSKTVTSLPTLKGLYSLLGYNVGILKFDNFEVYDYIEEDVASVPTFDLTGFNGTSRIFTISCNSGETIHYQVKDGDTEKQSGASASAGASVNVTVPAGQKLIAWTTMGKATSTSVEYTVVGGVPVLTAPTVTLTDIGVGYSKSYTVSNLTQSITEGAFSYEFQPDNVFYATSSTATSGTNISDNKFSLTAAGTYYVIVSKEGATSASTPVDNTINYLKSAGYDFTSSSILTNIWSDASGTEKWANSGDAEAYKENSVSGSSSRTDLFDGFTVTDAGQRHNKIHWHNGKGVQFVSDGGNFTIGLTSVPANAIIRNTYYQNGSNRYALGNTITIGRYNKTTEKQGLVAIDVYTPDPVSFAIADCKAFETSSEFATAIDAESFSTAAEVYAFHTAWQIAKADAASSNDITKVIFDAQVSDFSRWNNARSSSNQQYTGAPDNKYFDAWNNDPSDGKQKIYGLPAGTYTLKVATRASADITDKSKYNVWVSGGSANVSVLGNHIGNTGGCLGNGWNWTIVSFTLEEKADVEIGFYSCPPTDLWASADDWHLYKGSLSETATILSYGWATFSSDYPLDFTGISDFEAYMITGHDGNVVTKSQVTGTVPAGTGLLLKGDAKNYTIPVVASSSTDVSANKLVAGTGASVSKEDNMTKYVLGVNGENAEFQKIDGTAATVAKGKAYLVFNGENLARTMYFSGDVTAVENVEAAPAKAKEGKFIENGKLVIVKNGQKFNAAGAKLY